MKVEDLRAEAYFKRSLEMVDEYGFEAIRGTVLRYMGIHARDRGEYESAADLFKRSMASDMGLNRNLAVVLTLYEIAEWAYRLNPEHLLLPDLLAYLLKHPLTLDGMRHRILDLAGSIDIEIDETASEVESLDWIVERVNEVLLDHLKDLEKSHFD